MNIDEARKHLVTHCGTTYRHYIYNRLAGDFAVEIATRHRDALTELKRQIDIQKQSTQAD